VSDWLFRGALRLVPASWRASVRADIEEEARVQRRGGVWKSSQAIRVAARWRWTFGGGAVLTDVRYAIRSLAGARWFTVGAVVSFALGVGVNLAVFSAIDRMLFRRLPYANPAALVLLRSCDEKTGECAGAFPSDVAYALQRQSSTLESVAVAGFSIDVRLSRDETTEDVFSMMEVSPHALRALGVTVRPGRDITDEEVSAKARMAWISDEAWRARLGADANIVGRTFWAGDRPVTIAGVLPRGFIPPAWTAPNPEWAGLVVAYSGWSTIGPSGRILVPFARMRPGVTPADVGHELAVVQEGLRSQPSERPQRRENLRADGIERALFSRFNDYLWLVVAAAGLVLLMACTNLATLLVARGRAREQLAAIATALGASRARVLTTAVAESLTICLTGSALALAGVWATEAAISALLPPLFSRYTAGATDLRVLTFALLVACAAAVGAGLAPGWRHTKVDVLTVLQKGSRGGGRRTSPGARTLLAVQAALGCLLVVGSFLALRSFARLSGDSLGFDPTDLAVVWTNPGRLAPDEQRTRMEAALQAMRRVPGVRAAAGADNIPTTNEMGQRGFKQGAVRGTKIQVTDEYLATLGARLTAGRDFTRAEVASRGPVVILNRLAARALFPEIPPAALIGRMWQADDDPPREIIGIVQEFKTSYGDANLRPAVFLPMGAEPSLWTQLVIRPAAIRPEVIRSVIQEQFGGVTVRTLDVERRLDVSLVDARFRAVLLSVLACAGLAVAVVGLYAVASYDVAMRRYEMGVRLTLGAPPRALKRLILLQACRPVALGAGAGLVGAYWLAQFITGFLFNMTGRDPVTYAAVATVMVASALLAAWLPARRAAATDPAVVLKAQ
jgi:predicted permease